MNPGPCVEREQISGGPRCASCTDESRCGLCSGERRQVLCPVDLEELVRSGCLPRAVRDDMASGCGITRTPAVARRRSIPSRSRRCVLIRNDSS